MAHGRVVGQTCIVNGSVCRCCGQHIVTHILGNGIFRDSSVIGVVLRGVVRGAFSGSLSWGCISGSICVVQRALSVCTGRTVLFRVKVGLLELLSHGTFAAVIVGRRRLRGYCQDDIVRTLERWRKPCSRKGIVGMKESCRAKQRQITRSKRTSVVHFQLLCFQSFEVVSETTQLLDLRLCA